MTILSIISIFGGIFALSGLLAIPQYQDGGLNLEWILTPAAICISTILLFNFLNSKGW